MADPIRSRARSSEDLGAVRTGLAATTAPSIPANTRSLLVTPAIAQTSSAPPLTELNRRPIRVGMHRWATILRMVLLVAIAIAATATPAANHDEALSLNSATEFAAAHSGTENTLPCEPRDCDDRGRSDRDGCHPAAGCSAGLLALLPDVPSLEVRPRVPTVAFESFLPTPP